MKYMKHLYKQQVLTMCLLIVSTFILVRCTPVNDVTVTLTNDQVDSDQVRVSEIPATINVPLPTATFIMPVLTVSPIPSPTIISSTPVLVSTLTSKQKADSFSELMTDNGGCELPCWWGISPDQTRIETIAEQFTPKGLIWKEEWNQLDASRSGSGALVTFSTEENVIQTIKVWGGSEGDTFLQDWERYSLDQVLARYGMPSQVFVYYPYKADPGDSVYHLFLFYETLGIEIDYIGTSQDFVGTQETLVCPTLRDVFQINLFLYPPEEIDDVVETVIPPDTVDFIADREMVYDLISWEQATDTTLESFYDMFSKPDSETCFEFQRYWTGHEE